MNKEKEITILDINKLIQGGEWEKLEIIEQLKKKSEN